MDNEKQDNEENTTRKDDDFVDVPFEQLELNKWLIDQCKLLGYKKPTPIQYHCIPRILKGQDVIGCAKTGSGKTAAFALPIIQKLSEDPFGIYALVLTPTRLKLVSITFITLFLSNLIYIHIKESWPIK